MCNAPSARLGTWSNDGESWPQARESQKHPGEGRARCLTGSGRRPAEVLVPGGRSGEARDAGSAPAGAGRFRGTWPGSAPDAAPGDPGNCRSGGGGAQGRGAETHRLHVAPVITLGSRRAISRTVPPNRPTPRTIPWNWCVTAGRAWGQIVGARMGADKATVHGGAGSDGQKVNLVGLANPYCPNCGRVSLSRPHKTRPLGDPQCKTISNGLGLPQVAVPVGLGQPAS